MRMNRRNLKKFRLDYLDKVLRYLGSEDFYDMLGGGI